jgi:hypothetical protein
MEQRRAAGRVSRWSENGQVTDYQSRCQCHRFGKRRGVSFDELVSEGLALLNGSPSGKPSGTCPANSWQLCLIFTRNKRGGMRNVLVHDYDGLNLERASR